MSTTTTTTDSGITTTTPSDVLFCRAYSLSNLVVGVPSPASYEIYQPVGATLCGEVDYYIEGVYQGTGLPTPVLTGYTFLGWSVNENSTHVDIQVDAALSEVLGYDWYGVWETAPPTTTTPAPATTTTTSAPATTTTTEAPTTTTTTEDPHWVSPGGRVWKNRREQTRMYNMGYI